MYGRRTLYHAKQALVTLLAIEGLFDCIKEELLHRYSKASNRRHLI